MEKEVESLIVSVAAQGLEVAMLCREGIVEPGVGSQYLSTTEKGGDRSNREAPRTTRCGTLTLTKVLPEVQVRRWRRPSCRGFMTKPGSHSSLMLHPHPSRRRQCTR